MVLGYIRSLRWGGGELSVQGSKRKRGIVDDLFGIKKEIVQEYVEIRGLEVGHMGIILNIRNMVLVVQLQLRMI